MGESRLEPKVHVQPLILDAQFMKEAGCEGEGHAGETSGTYAMFYVGIRGLVSTRLGCEDHGALYRVAQLH